MGRLSRGAGAQSSPVEGSLLSPLRPGTEEPEGSGIGFPATKLEKSTLWG
jgi:hypothetical protein